jgi:hypothetical protein
MNLQVKHTPISLIGLVFRNKYYCILHLNIISTRVLSHIMSIDNKSVDITSEADTDDAMKYCIECGAKMSKKLRIRPACGENQM